ncbi:Longiborneol synthase CLM1 [Dirofilaria immitis]
MRLSCLPLRPCFLEQMIARRQSTYSVKIREKCKAKWDDFVKKTDFWKSNDVEGLWGFYGRHYTWHGYENFALHLQICGFLCLLTFYAIYGLKKVEVMTDRSWKGRNREFLWHAIEDRFGHEYAFAWEPFKESELPKLLLMRTLQKEMWAAALKRGTWFLDPQNN